MSSIIFLYVYAQQIYITLLTPSKNTTGIFNQHQSIDIVKNGNLTQILYEFKTEQGQILLLHNRCC
jgi:hypothetical protein